MRTAVSEPGQGYVCTAASEPGQGHSSTERLSRLLTQQVVLWQPLQELRVVAQVPGSGSRKPAGAADRLLSDTTSLADSGHSVGLTRSCHIRCGLLARSHLSQHFTFSLTSRRRRLTRRPGPPLLACAPRGRAPTGTCAGSPTPQDPEENRGPRASRVTASSALAMGWEATRVCGPPSAGTGLGDGHVGLALPWSLKGEP